MKYFRGILFLVLTLSVFNSTTYSQAELIKTIYFESNSYSIDKKYHKALDLVAKQLSSDTFGFLKVFGYADRKGSGDNNDILSGKRANAVYDYLLSHAKFDTTQVYVTWLGESAEAYDLHFPSAHIQQRCVDIWVTFYKKPKTEGPK